MKKIQTTDIVQWRLWQVGQCLRNTKDYPLSSLTFYSKRLLVAIYLDSRGPADEEVPLRSHPATNRPRHRR